MPAQASWHRQRIANVQVEAHAQDLGNDQNVEDAWKIQQKEIYLYKIWSHLEILLLFTRRLDQMETY